MITVRFVPLARPADLRTRRSQFKCSWSDSFDLLKRELRMVSATNVVLQAGYEPGQLRNDGWPKATSNPSHPAVIMSFDAKGRALSFPCSQYDRLWDNIRAIALSLKALRAVDRYGVTQRAEQYQGWAQLEAPNAAALNEDLAAAFFFGEACRHYPVGVTSIDQLLHSSDDFEQIYRMLAKRLHPDVGGDREKWDRMQSARDVLRAAHSRRKATEVANG